MDAPVNVQNDQNENSENEENIINRRQVLGIGLCAASAAAASIIPTLGFAQERNMNIQKNMPKTPLFYGLSSFPLTPTDEHGRVNTDNLGLILKRLVDAEVDSITVLGSTGIYVFLTREERRRAISASVEAVRGRIPVMAGIGTLRTDDAQNLARDAKAAGADALLLSPVSYFPLTEDEVFQHYVAVSNATDLPLCIYNNPGTTNFKFSHSLIERLAKVPNIVALKNPLAPGEDYAKELAALRTVGPKKFSIGYSGDWGCARALLEGADAWYSVFGGLLPKPALLLTRAAQAKDVAEANRINDYFQPLWALSKKLGSIRVVYAAANILNITAATPPRPVLPVSNDEYKQVASGLERLSKLGGDML